MQLIWFIAWVPGMKQGIVTGLAVGLAATGVRGHIWPFPRGPMDDPGYAGRRPAVTITCRGTGWIRPAPAFPLESGMMYGRVLLMCH